MSNWGGQCNVTHALATNSGARYFYTAFVANDAFITGVLVFAAVTLPVTLGSENGFTEQAILFGSQAAIIDGFRLEHLTI
jgi:hypothetical protein